MPLIRNPNFKTAAQEVAKVVESSRSSLVPWNLIVGRKSLPPNGLHAARRGKPEPLEIEAIARIVVEVVAPALGCQVQREQLPQLRRAFQKAITRRRSVSYQKQTTPKNERQSSN